MFRLLFLIFFLFNLFNQNLFAQAGIGSTKSQIKLEFDDIQGLNILQNEVNLNINSIEKFTTGTETNWLNSHLFVTGLSNFEISVKTVQPNFFSNGNETNLSVSNVKISAKIKNKTNSVFLSNQSQILISENNGGLINYIDIKYQIPAENTYNFLNQPNLVFSTIIIYTLIPN